MALQSSGQLSFSEIAGVIGASTPYSLRSMSSSAGFSSPDSVSDFYGYSPLKLLLLAFSESDKEVCILKQTEYYSDEDDFSKSKYLYSDSSGSFASPGYYSDSFIIRFWKGEGFDEGYFGTCKL